MTPERDALPQQQTSATVEQIPFRQTSAPASQDLIGVLVATIALLALTATSLWVAKKKGWLDRWIAVKTPVSRSGNAFRVENSVRLSRNTVLYQVEHGVDRYLIVESDRNINVAKVKSHPDEPPHANQ